jgi:hypothetical protein
MSSTIDVVVYGATGLVGGRVCGDLDDAGVAFAVAGRDRGALDKLAGVVAAADVRVAELEPAALARAFAGARVVINAAGPFEPVLVAALAARAHYVDLGGDQTFLHAMYERHESTARRAGLACVPGCAVNCAIGDWTAAWAAEQVCGIASDGPATRDAAAPRLAEDRLLDEVAVSYVFDELVLSPGTQRAVFGGLHARGLVWRRDRWEAIAPGAERRRINAGTAMGGERDVVSFPGGDVITLPRHLAARQIQTYTSTTRSAAATTALRVLARAMPLLPRRATDALATYTPADEEYARTRFAVIAQVRRDFAVSHVTAGGTDPYRTSAAVASWVARTLLARSSGPTGMLAPSELFRPGAALRELAASAQLSLSA